MATFVGGNAHNLFYLILEHTFLQHWPDSLLTWVIEIVSHVLDVFPQFSQIGFNFLGMFIVLLLYCFFFLLFKFSHLVPFLLNHADDFLNLLGTLEIVIF